MTTSSKGTPREVCACGSKNISARRTPSAAARHQVGGGQVVEVLRLPQHVHRRVVDGEEAGQRVERVRGLDLGDGALADRNTIALRQLEFERGLERAFEVDVELRLGETGDELAVRRRGQRHSRVDITPTCCRGAAAGRGRPVRPPCDATPKPGTRRRSDRCGGSGGSRRRRRRSAPWSRRRLRR